MNYVAGLLLLATKDEEQSFWLLTVLIRNILPSYHTKNMQGLIIDISVLAELIRLKCPQVYYLMESLHLPWPVIVTKWFICLYAEVLPVEVSHAPYHEPTASYSHFISFVLITIDGVADMGLLV